MIHHPKASMIGDAIPQKTRLTAKDYRDCATEGLTMAETAQRLSKSYDAVMAMARLHQITFKRARHGRPPVEDLKIGIVRVLKKGPRTISDIAMHMGLSEGTIRNHICVLERLGFAHISERIDRVAIWELRKQPATASLASQAITMRKNGQRASEQRSAQSGWETEGVA